MDSPLATLGDSSVGGRGLSAAGGLLGGAGGLLLPGSNWAERV